VPATTEAVLRGQRALWRLETLMPDEIRGALDAESPMLSHLLYCRGYRTLPRIRAFFAQGIVSHDPFLLPDMEASVQRILAAQTRGEVVAVYGDFDCDGITSAAALIETLTGLGLNPIAHIPTREDGHGLHPEALASLRDRGVTLIVTADCGVNAIEEVRVARGMGMDVVVTDHHQARVDGSLPDCPTVDPTRHDSTYPFPSLCGAGVVYKLAQALALRSPRAPDPEALLDLVALGTVADVVPLRDENRSLVMQGLERLKRTRRPGLLALFEAASVDQRRIDPVGLSFYLAPRINAANRMATPQLAYDLLTAGDPAIAAGLAAQLSEYNRQRQVLVSEKFAEVIERLGDPADLAQHVATGTQPPVLVVIGEWPAGISGLLASKLVDIYGLPAFVGTQVASNIISVSARGVPGVHIDEMLEACESALAGGLFLGHGGHARAGGFRVDAAKLETARSLLEEQARDQLGSDLLGAVLAIDAELPLRKLTLAAAQAIRSLAPFGMEFAEPLFLSRDVTLQRISAFSANRHARLRFRQGEAWMDGICFNAHPALLQLPLETRLDVVFHFQINEFNGTLKPEMTVQDWRIAA